MHTPNPLLKELAPHEVLELEGDEIDPDELEELEDPEVDVVEVDVEPDPVDVEEEVEELEVDVDVEVEVEVEVDEVVAAALDDVEVDEVVGWLEIAAGVSLQGLLGKAMYEGIVDGIAGT